MKGMKREGMTKRYEAGIPKRKHQVEIEKGVGGLRKEAFVAFEKVLFLANDDGS